MSCESTEYKKAQRLRKKRALVAMLGGKCHRCPYSKCIAALDFHHKDRASKSFVISRNLTRSLDVLKAEAAKCILLCANCHREEHDTDEIGGRPRDEVVIERILARKRAGLTNQQIADELEISHQAVGRRLRTYMDPDEYHEYKQRCGCPSALVIS